MTNDPFTPSGRLLYADYTVLCTGPDGRIERGREGLYDQDTRILSRRRLTIDGRDLQFVSSADLSSERRLTILLARRSGGTAGVGDRAAATERTAGRVEGADTDRSVYENGLRPPE